MSGLFVVDVEGLYELVDGVAGLLATFDVVVGSFGVGFVDVLVIGVTFVDGMVPGAVGVVFVRRLSEELVGVTVGIVLLVTSPLTDLVDTGANSVPVVELFIEGDEDLLRYAAV